MNWILIYSTNDKLLIDTPRLSIHDYIGLLQEKIRGLDFGQLTRVLCLDRIMLRQVPYAPPIAPNLYRRAQRSIIMKDSGHVVVSHELQWIRDAFPGIPTQLLEMVNAGGYYMIRRS